MKNINELIEGITPIYNHYKRNNKNLSGTESLKVMWDIGEILKKYIEKNNIKPHKLFWSVYGKSEGKDNVTQKSYITREFQNRCHRIRNIFKSKSHIEEEFPNLRNFTAFREAMPFFDNDKYKLQGEERKKLLKILNSNSDYKEIVKYIYNLQKDKIGKTNTRTQKLKELEEEKEVFIEFYNYIFRLLKSKDFEQIEKENINSDYLISLSKNVSALSQDGLKFFGINEISNLNDGWYRFAQVIKRLTSKKSAVERRRFRRLIPPERIVRLADMIHALTSKDQFMRFTK